MARLTIRNIEPLELEFSDGTVKIALFNNEAFMIYTEEFGDILKDIQSEIEEKPFEFAGKMLYCGLKVTEPNITLNECKNIVLRGGLDLIQEIFVLIIDNFLENTNEETKKISNDVNGRNGRILQGTEIKINESYWENLYFIYCIKMRRPEVEFFSSSTKKVLKLIEIYFNGMEKKTEITEVYDLHDFL